MGRRAQPAWTEPMLATLTDARFSDPDWVFERKLDGVRCLVFRKRGRARLMSRNRKRLDAPFPELKDALDARGGPACVADGEIVAFDGRVTSFARLQGRIGLTDPDEARRSGVRVFLYLFDLLHLDGRDLTALPLRERKSLLRGAVEFDDPVVYTAHRNEHGERFFRDACRRGWEGLIAKRADAPYTHGRSRDWLKFKCVNRQEFVIGGFTEPRGSRAGFGALLVGVQDDDGLAYAGKVGTGYDDDLLASLRRRLDRRERKTSPFARGPRDEAGVHWVRPDLVAEVAFTEWTGAGRLRHPRFVGLRTDKDAADVVRERPR